MIGVMSGFRLQFNMKKKQYLGKKESPSKGGRLLMQGFGLHKSFGGVSVLDGVSFNLHEGEVVLLRGANGSGKTTLLNVLTGNLVPDSGVILLKTNGSDERFIFPRKWWQNINPADHFLPERVAREGVGRSWQETRLFHSSTLIENIMAATSGHPGESPFNVLFFPKKVREAEDIACDGAKKQLAGLGLGGREASSGAKVSLGQAKRVAIARAVSGGAKILFLDEPLSGLDAEGVVDVIELLRQLVRDKNVTLVIIEHVWNVQHVEPLCTTTWDLDDGEVTVSEGIDEKSDVPSLIWTDTKKLFPEYHLSRTQMLYHGAKLDIYRKNSDSKGEVALEVRLLVACRGSRRVVGENQGQGLSFSLRAGDLALLHAPNGWGKTTLMDAIAGVQDIETGMILFKGSDISSLRSWMRTSMGLIYLRSSNEGFPSLSVDEISRLRGMSGSRAGIQGTRKYGGLSGGEKQSVFLERLNVAQQSVCLLDEPFSALDASAVFAISKEIMRVVELNSTALIALPSRRC